MNFMIINLLNFRFIYLFNLGNLLRKFDQLHITKFDGLLSYQPLLLIPHANKFEILTPPKPPPPGIININTTTLFLNIFSNNNKFLF